MSFHNMRAMMAGGGRPSAAREFDERLTSICAAELGACRDQLLRWHEIPHARYCHPREEHLLPLMVVAGASAGDRGRKIFGDRVMGVDVAAFQFG
jgi:aromatic ring-opening dioxygenase catalytic subunit (LigB family)